MDNSSPENLPVAPKGRAEIRHDYNNMAAAIAAGLKLLEMRFKDDTVISQIVASSLSSLGNIDDLIKTLLPSDVDPAKGGGVFPVGDRNSDGHPEITDTADRHELFFAAIEMTRMPMIVTDPNQPDNPIVFANQAFLNTTGYAPDEVVGHNCRFLQGPGSDPEAVANIRRAIVEKTDLAVELQNYRKDGTMFWNALFISPIFDRDGRLIYFFGSQLDVTRRREAEIALQRAQRMEAVGQLTGGIAHDFNNMLQVILGNLQLAQTVVDNPEKLRRNLQAAVAGAEKAKTLTQQLLAFSRKQPLQARVANLNRILTELRSLLSKTLGSNIDIKLDLAGDLSNTRLDIIQLEMAIINILANARDAIAGPGTVRVVTRNVKVKAKQDYHGTPMSPGDYVELAIADSGAGMSPEVLSHVTEPFFTTKEVGKGTGLGLAQVSGFVKQSEGGFAIDSRTGAGTTVRLLFPATQQASAEDDAEPVVAARADGDGERVLVVEDNPDVRQLACLILEQEGYAVEQADTADAALKRLRGDGVPIDILFTDIIMPGSMNGVGLAKEARKLLPELAVLVTTGFAEDVHGHTNAAEFEMIYKPYMPDELSAKIRGAFNRRRDHRS